MCNDVTTDLIIGLPSANIFYFTTYTQRPPRHNDMLCNLRDNGDRNGRWQATHDDANDAFIKRAEKRRRASSAGGVPTQHSVYTGEMKTLFVEINAVMDTGIYQRG